jgi:hypothetical protein
MRNKTTEWIIPDPPAAPSPITVVHHELLQLPHPPQRHPAAASRINPNKGKGCEAGRRKRRRPTRVGELETRRDRRRASLGFSPSRHGRWTTTTERLDWRRGLRRPQSVKWARPTKRVVFVIFFFFTFFPLFSKNIWSEKNCKTIHLTPWGRQQGPTAVTHSGGRRAVL